MRRYIESPIMFASPTTFSRKIFVLMNSPEDASPSPLDRIYEITGCRTQTQLARLLGIQQSSISDAKKRKSIPPEWLLTLLRLRGINPDWITNGTGPRHIRANMQTEFGGPHRPEDPCDPPIHRSILRCFPSQDLTDELLRRCRKNGQGRQVSFAEESTKDENKD